MEYMGESPFPYQGGFPSQGSFLPSYGSLATVVVVGIVAMGISGRTLALVERNSKGWNADDLSSERLLHGSIVGLGALSTIAGIGLVAAKIRLGG